MDLLIATVAQRPDLAPLLRDLAAMLGNSAALGFASLVAPVRPSGKHLRRDLSMHDYAVIGRDDGLPFDTTGLMTVPEALNPVYCDVEQDCAVYCEPAVGVHHGLPA